VSQSLHLVHLYPVEMNIYGDTGNRIVLTRRLEWRGIQVKTSLVGIGDQLPADGDIILGGGAQDAAQSSVEADLATKAKSLTKLAEAGAVMLMVCGMYQLLGRRFVTADGQDIKGMGILPVETLASHDRMIGNTAYDTPWGEVVGYENHSGKTFLDDQSLAWGKVVKGAGNNGSDRLEGCMYHNIFGTYSHGPILSKNPHFADELIRRALIRKYTMAELQPLDDDTELAAAKTARSRPR
jgi:lipid II isoglutaminyl synthase (glutamine-hydrolysing)